MSFIGHVDSAGHISLPKELLGDLTLREGDTLRIDRAGSEREPIFVVDTHIATGGLVEENGLLVWQNEGTSDSDIVRKVILAIRHERDLQNAGTFVEALD